MCRLIGSHQLLLKYKRFFYETKRFFEKRFMLSDFLSPNRVPSNFFTQLGDFLSLNYDFFNLEYQNNHASQDQKKILNKLL